MTDPTIAHLRTLSSGSLSKAEVNWLCDEVEDLRAEVERLRGWRDWGMYGADHHPGCSGAFPPHPCKCGLRHLLASEGAPDES